MVFAEARRSLPKLSPQPGSQSNLEEENPLETGIIPDHLKHQRMRKKKASDPFEEIDLVDLVEAPPARYPALPCLDAKAARLVRSL